MGSRRVMSSVSSLTVSGDLDGFPCQRAHVDQNNVYWWEVRFLHAELQRLHGERRQLTRWVVWVVATLATVAVPGHPPYYLPPRSEPLCLEAGVVSTIGMLLLFWVAAGTARKMHVKAAFSSYLRHSLQRCARVTDDSVLEVDPGVVLQVGRGGQASGFHAVVEAANRHPSFVASVKDVWDALHGPNALELYGAEIGQRWESSTHDIADIATFAAMALSIRGKRRVANSAAWTTLVTSLRRVVLTWAVPNLIRYIHEWHAPRYGLSGPAPARRRSLSDSDQRPYVQISAEEAWSILEDARRSGTSPRQALLVRRRDAAAGCHETQASTWLHKLEVLYWNKQALLFSGIRHLSLVADPSIHSNRNTMVAAAYSWEKDEGTYPAVQFIPPGKDLTPLDTEMPLSLVELAGQRRLHRVAALRELQSLSHMSKQLVGLSLPDFRLEAGCLRPVAQGEERMVLDVPGRPHVNVVLKQADGRTIDVLPAQKTEPPLLTVGLDQGSVGAAGMAFAQHMDTLLFVHWDKLHRLIRDVKLSLKHAAGGVFLKAQVFTSFIWGLNYKPYGSGAWWEEKRRMLDVFLTTETSSSPAFQMHAPAIAAGFGMPFSGSDDDYEAVFQKLSELPSFVNKGSLPKMSRWFSWNSVCEEQLPEYAALRMLLAHHFGGVPAGQESPSAAVVPAALGPAMAAAAAPPAASGGDPAAELRALRASVGGLKLAHRVMTDTLQTHAKILATTTRPLWTWYAQQVEHVKSPKQHLKQLFAVAAGSWVRPLQETLRQSLLDQRLLDDMGLPSEGALADVEAQDSLAGQVLDFVWHLVANRAWSLAAYACPP